MKAGFALDPLPLLDLTITLRQSNIKGMSVIANKYMTVTEVAEFLGISTARVRQILASGQLVGEKPHEQLWIVSLREVERFQEIDRPAGVHIDRRD